LFLRLEIFFLCVKIIKIKKINSTLESVTCPLAETKPESTKSSLKKFITRTVNEENIEDKDEYLNISETIIHVKMNKKHS